jgi:uncharacterized membrane protein YphA (DoxX/SURF4 family)
VGGTEIVCGLLVLLGWLTRLAALPLIVIMLVAFATTKADILAQEGFWAVLHASRTDWAMPLSSLALALAGSGDVTPTFLGHKAP